MFVWWPMMLQVALGRPTLYTGGPIHTVDEEDRVVEAMLVDGNRIVAVGDAASLEAQAPRTPRAMLSGQAIVPGFVDAHGHFPGEGAGVVYADLSSPPVGQIQTLPQLVERLREQADQTRRRKWVIGFGYGDTLMAEGRHPTREDLDAASAEQPIAAVHIG